MDHLQYFALVALVLSVVSCEKRSPEKVAVEEKSEQPSESAPEPKPAKKPIEDLSWDAASTRIRPIITDGLGQYSDGQRQLGRWAAHNMRWSEVYASKNETTLARARKDSEPEMFKRVCFSVRISQIVKDESFGIQVFRGVFSPRTRPTSFIAAGHTGDLVEQSLARFCGLVAGNYAYSNTGGGESQTVLLVGMFDLPENKGPPLAEENH